MLSLDSPSKPIKRNISLIVRRESILVLLSILLYRQDTELILDHDAVIFAVFDAEVDERDLIIAVDDDMASLLSMKKTYSVTIPIIVDEDPSHLIHLIQYYDLSAYHKPIIRPQSAYSATVVMIESSKSFRTYFSLERFHHHKLQTMYPLELIAPMSKELTDQGFQDLKTPEEVDRFLQDQEGTALLVVNSVCGCAAANARPGALASLTNEIKPDHTATVFAGVHREATERAREHMLPYPASSPSIALFKNGKIIHMLERHHIEGRSAQLIAENLKMAYDAYCG